MPPDGEQEQTRINEESVDTLLATVREFLKNEDGREQSFNARAGGLAGFVGIIVSVTTAAGKLALDEDPSCLGAALGAAAFVVAMSALLGSLIIAITKILIPQEGAAIDMKTIERYATWQYVSKDKAMIQGEVLRGLITALAKDRQRNSSKATWLRRAYKALLVGVAALAAFGTILAVDAL